MAVEAQHCVNFKLVNFILVKSPSHQAHARVSKGVIVHAWLGYSYRVCGNCRLNSHCSASVNKAIQRDPYAITVLDCMCRASLLYKCARVSKVMSLVCNLPNRLNRLL